MMVSGAPSAVLLGGDAPTRALLAFVLTTLGCTVHTCGSLDDLAQAPHAPALLLLVSEHVGADVTLPLRAVRHWQQHVPTVLLARTVSADGRRHAFALGASDVITLPAETCALQARLCAALGDRPPAPTPSTLRAGGVTLDTERRLITDAQGRTHHLTRREVAVLGLLMQQPGDVVGRHALLDAVWGVDYVGTGTVLEVYVHRLRSKLAHPDRPYGYIRTAARHGYVFEARRTPRPAQDLVPTH